MEWNRKTRRMKVGKVTLESYLDTLASKLPEVIVGEKPMNHKEGLRNVVLVSTEKNLHIGITSYINKVQDFYDTLVKDIEDHSIKVDRT